jgi:uncharacterized protein (TIGR02284 family)
MEKNPNETRGDTVEEDSPKSSVVSLLNDLISICKDGKQGFETAAEGLDDAELKALCLQLSKQREIFAGELQDEVSQLGGTPESSGSLAGSLHRGWINIKSAVTGNNEDAIIAECERGEDEAKEAYEKALNAYMPANITGMVQRQYVKIKEAHDRFSAMKKTAQRS